MGKSLAAIEDPVQSASEAGLRYVSDATPGIRRVGTGKTFRYFDKAGKLIRNPAVLQRIRSLAVPPAWRDVWICANANGHLQAVGRDARGRKQYRYHPRWREIRDETKYHRMVEFGKALPRIRRRVSRDLRARHMTREKVLATVIRLLEATSIRVGNEEYVRQNRSFGLTTLRDEHVRIHRKEVCFYFRGKSGKKHAISVEDANLARIVRRLRDLPGYELFRYYGDDGELHSVGSAEVNDYLRRISGSDFTTKDFRTWNGTVLAAAELCALKFTNSRQAKRNIKKAIERVAEHLGNTVAVCRKCYVHPAILDAYMKKSLQRSGEPSVLDILAVYA